MNEQQGNYLDRRVRQALDRLPDGPAPGTAFDGGKLWAQLRPQLATQPVIAPKRTGQVRWLVAASVAGLLVVGLWWSWLPEIKTTVVTRQPNDKTAGRYVPSERVTTPVQGVTASATSDRDFNAIGNQLADRKAVRRSRPVARLANVMVPATQPQPLANVPNAERLPTEPPALNAEPTTSQVTVAVPKVIAPKRRFQVVHENELKAEEEAVYSQIQTKSSNERFVRIGTGNQVSTGSDEPTPAIQLPLNRKSTQ